MSKNITCDLKILNGTPVVAGTRIPVSKIIYLLRDGFTLEAIHNEYPHISVEKLNSVMEEVAQSYGAQTV